MVDKDLFATLTDNVVVIADHDTVGAIMVAEGTKMGSCLSRGAAIAFQSLFFNATEDLDETIASSAQDAFIALTGSNTDGSSESDVATATRAVTFAEQLVEFVNTAGPFEVTRVRPRRTDATEEVHESPFELALGSRMVALDPGRLQVRQIGGRTVGYHRSTFEFPSGSLTPDNDIVFTGGRNSRNPFSRDEGLAGCTTCGICGSCAACTLCAEVNFAVAAGFLVAVDFAIHLMEA